MNLKKQNYYSLVDQIGKLLNNGRQQAIKSVNNLLVQTNWLIGQYIVEYEQGGDLKSDYGSELIDNLSKDLTERYGKGFSRSNIFQMRLFYIKFQKIQTVSGQLTWSHYTEIL